MLSFGDQIRALRLEKRLSQRDLAELIGIDFTYLSKIENGKVDPPSEMVIRKLAGLLDADAEELLDLAGKVSSDEIRMAVGENPAVGVLFRRLQSRQLSDEQIRRMLEIASEEEKGE